MEVTGLTGKRARTFRLSLLQHHAKIQFPDGFWRIEERVEIEPMSVPSVYPKSTKREPMRIEIQHKGLLRTRRFGESVKGTAQ